MGNIKAYFIALCIVVGTVGQCLAHTGKIIREACQIALQDDRSNPTLDDALKAGTCFGFVAAIFSLGSDLAEPDRFCTPNGVDEQQAMRVLVKYLNEHPELTHESAVRLSLQAFKEAWPCR
jgi:hypothetical protein